MPRLNCRFVAVAIGLAATSVAFPIGASAPAAPDPIDVEINKARAEVEQAQAEAHAADDQLQAARANLAAVESQIAGVQAQIDALSAQIPALRAEIARLRGAVHRRAAALYRQAGAGNGAGDLTFEPSMQAVRRAHLGAAAAEHDGATMRQLDDKARQLEEIKAALAEQEAVLSQQQAELAKVQATLEARQAEFDRRVEVANAALARAQKLGAMRARGEPVLGPTILSGAQMAAWFRSQNYHARIATSIDDLANIYMQEGQAESVRGDLAFAQSIVETGGFRSAPANNYSGMGWCDSCRTGTRFPTPRDGVRAQIQHLKNYADPKSRARFLHHAPSLSWYGSDPSRAIHNFDTFFAKGWAPNWRDMGHGNWATDKTYSGKVLRVYASMIVFAQSH